MGITLAIFKDFGNIPFSKYRFIKFARGTLMVLSNTFKSFVGILLGSVAFLRFNVFIKDYSSLGAVGVGKNVFLRTLPRKSEYFLSVCTIMFSSGKQSDPGHFSKSQGKIFLSFLYTLFSYF